jgi:cytochrome oxidase Cu insertion factor (SCO1/SenC/PrrC family)
MKVFDDNPQSIGRTRKIENVTRLSTSTKRTGAFAITILSLFLLLAVTERLQAAEVDYLEKLGVMRIKEKVDAPAFTLPDLLGKKRSLKDFKGKFVMLNFWATW